MQLGSENALKRGVSEKLRRRSTQCDRSQKSRCVMMFFPIIGGYLPALPDGTIPRKNTLYEKSSRPNREPCIPRWSDWK